ncbi:cytidylate kinase-like family protein [Desulfobacula toluolica]|uniref:Cmk: cytidylate kinase n=1 Tax=Desulfobacula toluolica (strain DSM 7467 / Tol2) TaxID=651182 RepID=K0NEZ1_DESTT|nr:cytidylate kinase-like family protein [Desulfobacula toluolica]CCK78173.1 Cmk: cytidylate kinase [Desulfobacula toluolica Tol2]
MPKSIQKRIDEQIKKWEMEKKEAKPIQEFINVITISRECGSQGCEVAERLCSETGLDLFDKKILEAMVDISKTNRGLLETLDERSMNIVDDIISNFVNEHHLWADEYSKLLLKILTTIGKHGNAVILGRGANCVLKGKNVLRVKIVAPMTVRRNQTQKCHGMNLDDAMKHMVSTDSNRTAFVKRYFNCDANDPSNYDLILNTGTLSVEKAVQIIKCAIN